MRALRRRRACQSGRNFLRRDPACGRKTRGAGNRRGTACQFPRPRWAPWMKSSIDHLIPGSIEHRARVQALRTVALMEMVKGVLVLAAAISLYWVDASDAAGAFLNYLHISPDRHFAHLLFGLADRISNVKLWHLILGAS